MIPSPNVVDLDRDPEEDYEYATGRDRINGSCAAAWIRRGTAAETALAAARGQAERLRGLLWRAIATQEMRGKCPECGSWSVHVDGCEIGAALAAAEG